ncbi:MAG: DUF1573 domain-containing protein [Cytophagales bacterium]|nr:DUF1573 domain-containing protein [Cytophagales bacterium]
MRNLISIILMGSVISLVWGQEKKKVFEHDVGFVKEKKDTIWHSFFYHHTQTDTLYTEKTKISCECLIFDRLPNQVLPEDTVQVRIGFIPWNRLGRFEKDIHWIFKNQDTLSFHIQGHVLPGQNSRKPERYFRSATGPLLWNEKGLKVQGYEPNSFPFYNNTQDSLLISFKTPSQISPRKSIKPLWKYHVYPSRKLAPASVGYLSIQFSPPKSSRTNKKNLRILGDTNQTNEIPPFVLDSLIIYHQDSIRIGIIPIGWTDN